MDFGGLGGAISISKSLKKYKRSESYPHYLICVFGLQGGQMDFKEQP